MIATLKTELCAYAHSLAALGVAANGTLAARSDGAHALVSRQGASLSTLTEADISEYGIHELSEHADILRIFAARSDLSGLFLLDSPFCKTVSETKRTMRASLDDTAQIAGGRIRTASSDKAADVLPCIKRNFGCFLAGAGQLTVGRSLHEAYVAALVLEKGARAEVQAAPFGGAKPLSTLDCVLMRSVYLKKYSQIQEQSL